MPEARRLIEVKDLLVLFGKRIRALRSERGWSQEEFAYQCGLHRTYIGHVELGKKNISFNNLVAVSAALGITLSELFAGLEDGAGKQAEQIAAIRPTEAKGGQSGKVTADMNRLLTELRVQRLTMERALATINTFIAASAKGEPVKATTLQSRRRSKKDSNK